MSFVDIGMDDFNFDLEAEQEVLAEIFSNPKSIAMIGKALLPVHFHDPMHSEIFAFAVMFLQAGRPIRLVKDAAKRRWPEMGHYFDDLVPAPGGRPWEVAAAIVLQKASERGQCGWCGYDFIEDEVRQASVDGVERHAIGCLEEHNRTLADRQMWRGVARELAHEFRGLHPGPRRPWPPTKPTKPAA